ncbi:hypothetical protein CLG94_06205 [Candidatus Methylomirabilis limnetica]|uniref:Uncharacterized protein n=2 Tax=Candidatus Methylomirabilis limnetica TaxID=2033718 RepID=A0A2T4TYP5_9BACT|nr:hypothetical protein CLG94_06205 [Candidatus Methylomirabilis limnetica]
MMRFVVTGEWTQNRLLRLIILWFLIYSAGLWLTNTLLFLNQMGLRYESVVAFYRGSETQYLLPRSYKVLLEISHFHLLAMGIFILTLSHLVLFVPLTPRVKYWLIHLTFLSAISDEAAGWLTRFVHPLFAYYKIGAFVLLQTTMAVLIIAVLLAVRLKARSAYTEDV